MLDEIADLIGRPSGSSVGDGPGRLFSRLELGLLEDLDEDGEKVGVDHRLDLLAVA